MNTTDIPTVTVDELWGRLGMGQQEIHPDPQAEIGRLLDYFAAHNAPLIPSPQERQVAARSLIAQAAEVILAADGQRLCEYQRELLAVIHEGVLVADNITESRRQLRATVQSQPRDEDFRAEAIYEPVVDVFGMVIGAFEAILLDPRLFSRGRSESFRLFAAAHELWHVLSGGRLPKLINEAATDIHAMRSLRSDELFVSWSHLKRCGYLFWILLEHIAGKALAFEAYMEPPIIEEVWDEELGGWRHNRYLEHPLHDFMRALLGVNSASGEYWWDMVTLLAIEEQVAKATGLLLVRAIVSGISGKVHAPRLSPCAGCIA